ncbi:MAG: ABC transporter permease [Parvibaculaceae bacterium]
MYSLRTYFKSSGYRLMLLPAGIILVFLFVIPIADVVRTSLFDPSFTIGHFQRFFQTPIYPKVFLRTVYVALIVTWLCFLVGYPTAYFLAHCRKRTQVYLLSLILVPFWMSLLIRTYSWIALLGRQGVINTMLLQAGIISEPLPMLYTSGVVYVAMVQILVPIMILTCFAVMVEIDQGLVRAARVLGATRWRAFVEVYFPLSFNGVTTGAIIIFILSMGFFVTPALLGGRQDLMAGNLIEIQVNQMVNWGFASALSVILLAITIAFVMLFKVSTARFQRGLPQS